MKRQQVCDNGFAVLNEKYLVCDANFGLIHLGGVGYTLSDLPHGRRMIERFGKAWKSMPRRVVETLEDGDPVCVNHLFEGAMDMKSQLEPGTVVSVGGMQTAPAWTTTISANRARGSISASNGWAGCVAQALT